MIAVMMEEIGAAPVYAMTRTPAAMGDKPWTIWKRCGSWKTPVIQTAPNDNAFLSRGLAFLHIVEML